MATSMRKDDDDNQSGDSYRAQQAAGILLTFHEHHKSPEETEAFIRENIKFTSIRKIAVEQYIEKQNYDPAIVLCREGIIIAEQQNYPGLVNQWYEKLLEIYEACQDKKGIVECADHLFLQSHLNLRYYSILKKELSPDEWKKKQPYFLEKLQQHRKWYDLALIYSEENRKQELMNTLRMSQHASLIKEFQKHLMPEFKDSLQQLYFEIVLRLLEQYADRNHYREAAVILKGMKSDFDVAHIQLFAIELSEKYRQRPALLDELKSL
jgi:hypothetical protein